MVVSIVSLVCYCVGYANTPLTYKDGCLFHFVDCKGTKRNANRTPYNKKPTNNLQIVSRFCELECRCFEAETCRFIEAEHDVHVLYGLTYSTFQ